MAFTSLLQYNYFVFFILFITIFCNVLSAVLSAPSITSSIGEIKKEPGCLYENRIYREGEKVQLSEPCLRCHCLNNNLVCRLRVCIQVPDPPPPGCFILQHRNDCCPKLVCDSDMGYSSGSNSILEARSGSATVHQTIPKEKGEGCIHNGTVYAEGSAMDTSSLCEYCYCIKGEQHCVRPQCLLSLPGCEPEYTNLTCCPTKYNCSHMLPPTTTSEPVHKKGCEVNGKNYPEGELIKELSKECENCYCVHGEIRCKPTICSIPDTANQHCSPVYTTGHCCPSSYKCTSEGGDEIAETRHYSSVHIPSDEVIEGVIERKAHHSNPEDKRQITTNSDITTMESLIDKPSVLPTNETNSEENSTTNIVMTADISQTDVTLITTTMISLNDTESTTGINDITTMQIIDEVTTLVIDENTIDNNLSTINDTNEFSTTVITPTDIATVLPTVTEINDNVSSSYTNESGPTISSVFSTTLSSFKGYNYTKPNGYISHDIEAIINITQNNNNKEHSEDYEYDYNEPSLPPSLPNLRIIPFVAADAVVSKTEEAPPPSINYPQSLQYPMIYEKPPPLLAHSSERPVYYKVSHPNRFSPPTETEGGFVPHEPIIDHPFYESKIDIQPQVPSGYHTSGFNVDITVAATITEAPTITQSHSVEKRCLSNGRRYNHGELISEPTSCEICTCFFGEIICQEPKCSALQPGCIRLPDHALGCCGRIICGSNELDSPTRVVDRIDHGTPNPASPLQQSAQHLPPFTIADSIVTPDPFRDVIRTEPAPDLPSVMGDIIHLWEHSTSQTSTSTLPSITTGSPEESHSIININDDINYNKLTTTNLPKINTIDSLTVNTSLYNFTTIPLKDLQNVRNTSSTNSSSSSINNKPIDQIFSSQTVKELFTNNKENTTPLIATSTNKINIMKEDVSSTTFKTTVKIITSGSNSEPVKITKTTAKTENPLSIIRTTISTTTEEINDFNGEQKIEEEIEENEDDDSFSFSSMFDIFFNGGNSDNVITTEKPRPFKLTTPIPTTTVIATIGKTETNIKLLKNETNFETTTKNIPLLFANTLTTLSNPENNFFTNKSNVTLYDKNNSSSSNITNLSALTTSNKLVSNRTLTTVTENLKPLLRITEKYGYPDRNIEIIKLTNDNDRETSTALINNNNNKLNYSTTSPPNQNIPDPGATSGLLKLAGCNIYGRMYRVGRIISELSGPCLECMCTEVGVQCRPLPC